MPHSRSEVFLHFVWTTWERLPLLTPELRLPVYACIRSVCSSLKAEVLALGGTVDHVHLLARTPATLAPAALAKRAKGVSSHLVRHRLAPDQPFRWQGSYAVLSVSPQGTASVAEYIHSQEEHHGQRGEG